MNQIIFPDLKRAVFPGSFDPFTNGHLNILSRAIPLFDEIIIAIGTNTSKKYMMATLELRAEAIRRSTAHLERIKVMEYNALTVDLCHSLEAGYILRGLRTSTDFEYEKNIAQMNAFLAADIQTVFLISSPEHTPLTSTIVREIYLNAGDISAFVPPGVLEVLKR